MINHFKMHMVSFASSQALFRRDRRSLIALMFALILVSGCAAPRNLVIEEDKGPVGPHRTFHNIKESADEKMRQKLDSAKRMDR